MRKNCYYTQVECLKISSNFSGLINSLVGLVTLTQANQLLPVYTLKG